MASITGIVDCINVADDQGFVSIVDNDTGIIETFIIWVSPTEPSAFTRVMHSMWVSFFRDSIDSGRNVTVTTLSTGAFITGVTLNR